MACGMIAMRGLGWNIERYVAFEVDKYAIKTATHNFQEIEERGDVFDADFTEFQGFDWLIGGSPCTYWSVAQTKNRETEASGLGWELFSQYVRALHEAKPKYFLYENNKSMAKAIRASITETFGFEPIEINSALVSAQTRKRLYWVGIRREDGGYRKADIEQPEDREIYLQDVLQTGVAWREKAYCLRATNGGHASDSGVVREIRTPGKFPVKGYAEPLRIGTIDGAKENGLDYSKQYKVYAPYAKGTALCGNGGGMGAKTGLYAAPVDEPDASPKPVYKVENGEIEINGERYPIKLKDGYYIIRMLTVRECMRLQTVPEWYDWPVSKSQALKMLGNGWTVEIIKWLLLKGIIL